MVWHSHATCVKLANLFHQLLLWLVSKSISSGLPSGPIILYCESCVRYCDLSVICKFSHLTAHVHLDVGFALRLGHWRRSHACRNRITQSSSSSSSHAAGESKVCSFTICVLENIHFIVAELSVSQPILPCGQIPHWRRPLPFSMEPSSMFGELMVVPSVYQEYTDLLHIKFDRCVRLLPRLCGFHIWPHASVCA